MKNNEYEGAHLKRERVIQNVETNKYKEEISFIDVMGNTSSTIVDSKLFANLRRFHEELVGEGARIPKEFDKAKEELKDLIRQPCEQYARVVYRCGWHGDTYVNGHSVCGRDPNIVLEGSDDTLTLGMQKGDFKSYIAGIKPLLNHSRIPRLAMAAQCASILSERVGV